MKAIVTGGAGFIGCNAASRFLRRGDEVVVIDNLSRRGTPQNLDWLKPQGKLTFVKTNIADAGAVKSAIESHADANLILHLAGQVAVTSSVVDPRDDFEANALGTFNVLEAVRAIGSKAPFLYASTNKVYGGMEDLGIVERNGRYDYADYPDGVSEQRGLDFHSPYGCSKGAADQYVRDYHRIYGLNTVVFRQSCIYGYRQFGLEDQGWVAWFVIAAQLGRPISIFGDGMQVRDVLFIDDLIDAYEAAAAQIEKSAGEVYNVGGGRRNTISLLDLLEYLGKKIGRPLEFQRKDWRPGDQRCFISDNRKAERELGWTARTNWQRGLDQLYDWVASNKHLFYDAQPRMRILFVSPIGHIGGAERVLLDLIESLQKLSPGIKLDLLLLADGPLVGAARSLGTTVRVLPAPDSIAVLGDSSEGAGRLSLMVRALLASPRTLLFARELRRAVESASPDIVHSIGLKTHLLLGISRPKNTKIVWHIHDFVGSRPLIAGLLRRVALHETAVAVSSAVAEDTGRCLPGADVRTVLNGIDTDRFCPGPAVAPREDASPTGALRIGMIATYARWKGQDTFIRAAARLVANPSLKHLQFLIVGGPIYTTRGSQFSEDELQALIGAQGIADRVRLVGYTDDLVQAYRALDVVVHASTKPEPFGLTIAEAMSCGRPVIVSNAGGAAEVFEHQVDAMGIPCGDDAAMAAAIGRLAQNPELRVRIGSRARETAVRLFTRDRMAGEMVACYRSLIDR